MMHSNVTEHVYFCLSVWLSSFVCLPLSALSVCLSRLFVCLCLILSVCPFDCRFVYLPPCLCLPLHLLSLTAGFVVSLFVRLLIYLGTVFCEYTSSSYIWWQLLASVVDPVSSCHFSTSIWDGVMVFAVLLPMLHVGWIYPTTSSCPFVCRPIYLSVCLPCLFCQYKFVCVYFYFLFAQLVYITPPHLLLSLCLCLFVQHNTIAH